MFVTLAGAWPVFLIAAIICVGFNVPFSIKYRPDERQIDELAIPWVGDRNMTERAIDKDVDHIRKAEKTIKLKRLTNRGKMSWERTFKSLPRQSQFSYFFVTFSS